MKGTLFADLDPLEPDPARRALVRAFREFHRHNPQVYTLVDRFTREAIGHGRTHLGMKMVWERIRWYTAVETTEESPKLNNNHTAYYARLWMANNPEHAGFFRTRSSSGEDEDE